MPSELPQYAYAYLWLYAYIYFSHVPIRVYADIAFVFGRVLLYGNILQLCVNDQLEMIEMDLDNKIILSTSIRIRSSLWFDSHHLHFPHSKSSSQFPASLYLCVL
jgi:hypothetical protein